MGVGRSVVEGLVVETRVVATEEVTELITDVTIELRLEVVETTLLVVLLVPDTAYDSRA